MSSGSFTTSLADLASSAETLGSLERKPSCAAPVKAAAEAAVLRNWRRVVEKDIVRPPWAVDGGPARAALPGPTLQRAMYACGRANSTGSVSRQFFSKKNEPL